MKHIFLFLLTRQIYFSIIESVPGPRKNETKKLGRPKVVPKKKPGIFYLKIICID